MHAEWGSWSGLSSSTTECGFHGLLFYKGTLEVALAFADNMEGLAVSPPDKQ